MLPVREVIDSPRPRRDAWAVTALVVANAAVFLLEWAIAAGDRSWMLGWALVPKVLTEIDPVHGVLTIATSMFLHGGWLHLLGNLWFLWVFGRSVEGALGPGRFVGLYAGAGVVAAAAQVAIEPSSVVP